MWNINRALQATMVFVFLPVVSTHAQVTIDMSKVTCGQYVLYQIPHSDYIPFWLQGYYSAKRGTTVIDTQQFKANADKVKQYCQINSNVPIMQAVETLMGVGK
jgi:acid stress chaperone HdeB